MAKAKARASKRPWKADPEDAIRLAALRWLATELEQMTVEIYASDKGKYDGMEDILRGALKEMKKLGRRASMQEEDECPPGYVLCKDGLCAPMCDSEESS